MKVIDCFNIFLFEDTIPIKIDILKFISKQKNRRFASNRKGIQYNVNLKDFKKLTTAVEKHFSFFKEKLSIQDKHNFIFNSMWLNVNPPLSYNIPHVHPNCILSGVYYFKVPLNSGNLVLKHPSQSKAFDEYNYKAYNCFNSALYNITPIENKLYIFSNDLEHYVEPNYSNDTRISVSFNLSISKD